MPGTVGLNERNWECSGVQYVDALNEKLVENVRGAAVRHVGIRNMNGRLGSV